MGVPGDANRDGRVDVSDLGILAANYGLVAGAAWAQGDFNADGRIDVGDLGILAAHYGQGAGGTPDFNQDAKAFNLSIDGDQVRTKKEAPVITPTGCDLAGLPLIGGVCLAGLLLAGLKIKFSQG